MLSSIIGYKEGGEMKNIDKIPYRGIALANAERVNDFETAGV